MQLPERDPQLDQLDVLVGEWDAAMTHPQLTGVTRGHSVFEWLPGRTFLIWRSSVAPGAVPSSIAIIGGGSTPGVWSMEYFDSRGVSRTYRASFDDGIWKLWRDHPGFSQRATGVFENSGLTVRLRWELMEDGPWKPDLDVTYTRRSDR